MNIPVYLGLSVLDISKIPVYLGLSVLDISKIAMYEFWYDYVKSRYKEIKKLCYMDTDSFIACIKHEIFTWNWRMMLKQKLILQITN